MASAFSGSDAGDRHEPPHARSVHRGDERRCCIREQRCGPAVIDPEDQNDGIMARQCLFEEAFVEGASLGDAHAFAGCDSSLRARVCAVNLWRRRPPSWRIHRPSLPEAPITKIRIERP